MTPKILGLWILAWNTWFSALALAGTDGGIRGQLHGPAAKPVAGGVVELLGKDGKVQYKTTSSTTGEFDFFPVTFGEYEILVKAGGLADHRETVRVGSSSITGIEIELQSPSARNVVVVTGDRSMIHTNQSASVTEISKRQIEKLPQGEYVSMPKLMATTTPGIVQGPFGQTFIRGNHANIQYQIDGVQLPDSASNNFGDAFTPRNIDHMEVITGGIPAEYGERLAAVVNIITKTGAETPGGSIGITYGSYNTWAPNATLTGSTPSGEFHYYISGVYQSTDRGLDTPQPESYVNQKQGGTRAEHDRSTDNVGFAKFDWLPTNADRISFIGFNSRYFYQIPNFPNSFHPTDTFFQPGYADAFGNNRGASPTFNWTPSNTNDNQTTRDTYAQVVWKHMFTESSSIQVAPYWKQSNIQVFNDHDNDLASASTIQGANPSSFSQNRVIDNYGLKIDLVSRLNSANLFKTGLQIQTSRSKGSISVTQPNQTPPPQFNTSTANATAIGNTEALYIQDDLTVTHWLTLNFGLRYDATQYQFSDLRPTDQMWQPRLGANILLTETTKWHLFYGKLFQPAPAENLRDTFIAAGSGQLTPYDIKAEKDDYYETGLTQQIWARQVASVTNYYKQGINMLDDAQLLNTPIAQPYNFAHGFAYGTELKLAGQINDNWSDFANYAHENAKGKGISGGLFAFAPDAGPSKDWQYLDHVQIDTANVGITYSRDSWWWSGQGNYGSGLRTGPNNTLTLPQHYTADTTVGYAIKSRDHVPGFKISGDVLNILDNRYPISIANGYNGSHYAAGREYFVHLSTDF